MPNHMPYGDQGALGSSKDPEDRIAIQKFQSEKNKFAYEALIDGTYIDQK